MAHMAYPTSLNIRTGTEITILGSPVLRGDDLIIEYPNNDRAKGIVKAATTTELTVEIDSKEWSLVRSSTAPMAGKGSTAVAVWRVKMADGIYLGRVIP